ncbi:ABC transporter permease [Umezawaea sp.]|uniref:ABC transporter permease n=1 Tax=Umezawaea sp. TaxID=1955258 RepID=UPI002ED55679
MSRTSFASATWLVAEREMNVLVRTKGFWIGFVVTVAGLFALIVLPTVFGGEDPEVAAVGSAASAVDGKDLRVRVVPDLAAAEALVRADEVEAAVVPDTTGESAIGVRVVALNDAPDDVISALVAAPPVDLLDASAVSPGAQRLVILVFALFFLLFGMGGAAIAQSTVTEKQTRIVEILVSTVPIRSLLAGKILGHVLLTMGQVVVLALAAPIALRLADQGELLAVVAPALGWFVPFLCLGFVLLAAMWAVAGALVSRQEDLGSTMGLAMILVMGPYFGVQFFSDNVVVMQVLSFVPFSAAVAMPVRLFTGDAAVWEALVSMGVLAASAVLIVLGASRVYSGSLLQTGGRVGLAKAWSRAD